MFLEIFNSNFYLKLMYVFRKFIRRQERYVLNSSAVVLIFEETFKKTLT